MDKKEAKKVAKAAAGATALTVSGVFRIVLKTIVTILLIILTTGLLFTCIFAYYVKTSLSQDLDITLEDVALSQASTIYYTNKEGNHVPMATLHGLENRIWVDYENIPQYLEYAAVAIEDRRFYEHKGVDWYRTVAAFGNMFMSMKNDFGGSTLTQQLLKNITKEDDITVQRKLLEIFRALKMEKMYNKEEIMEWYLNVIYLGEGCNGVGTAANVYFDKDVWDLTLAECASLIGITNNPSRYDPYISRDNNKERQEIILFEMYDQGYISQEEYLTAKEEKLVFKRGENEGYEMTINNWYTDAVYRDLLRDLQEQKGINKETANNLILNGGLQIYSSMDPDIQAIVDNVYNDPANFPAAKSPKGESLQSSVVILDPYTGEIKALSGGVGKKAENLGYCRATLAQRPPGSSFKPIAIYAPALDQGLISPSTLVNDAPDIKLQGTTWYPKNANFGNSGIVTIQQALTASINTVSAQILDKLKPSVSFDYLQNKLGVTSMIEADRDYAPLSLGQLTNGITVREMAQAYDAFVNDGVFTYSRTYTHVTDSEGNMVLDNTPKTIVAFKANTAWTISYMLQIAAAQGTGSEAGLGRVMASAGKTGSSNDYMDRWFVGYTPYYVAAVWTGYDTPSRMYVSGNPSAQIWRKLMLSIHEGLEYRSFKQHTPSGPTNIFGDLRESPSPSPSEEPSEEPTVSPSDPISSSPPPWSENPSTPPTPTPTPTPPTPSLPVTPPPSPTEQQSLPWAA